MRWVGAPELTLDEVQRVGLPRYSPVNVEGSALVKAEVSVGAAHRYIDHRDIATLILLAGSCCRDPTASGCPGQSQGRGGIGSTQLLHRSSMGCSEPLSSRGW